MIHSLEINGYRGLRHLTMSGLGRINLLVGSNNSGKTSVLEAIYFLTKEGDPRAIWSVLDSRGERLEASDGREGELDICHLFFGHVLKLGTKFSVSSDDHNSKRYIEYEATIRNRNRGRELEGEEGDSSVDDITTFDMFNEKDLTPLSLRIGGNG